ncbi:hypothetical protein [Streptomyces sp. SAJ15]|uniref:hypothetical protein n=1 Tax=Streptomyces sp. SAJ15 TaxID=2011095 RepID=UPI001186D5F2|nr:hypothetical protein [Streptomyces sp. SAJ15]TVL89725.1 hypothetical protein CD790_25330 [Streptomyces sp. SAJ15]
MSDLWSDIAGLCAASLSAAAAAGSWVAAHKANKTAEVVASIEQSRWHADLTPQFAITIEHDEDGRAALNVQLVGPLALRHLNEINVRITSSDDLERTDRLTGSVPQEELDAQVWGPYRFTHGADGADINGHTVRPVPMEVGRGRPFSIERTRPPHWMEGGDVNQRWRDQWLGQPMRLVLTCRQAGVEKPWIVPAEIDVPESPRMRWL